MALDLTNLSAEDIAQLKQLLGVKDDSGRSPIWKPLRDMRMPQTAKGRLNRPHFEWSADDDGHTVIAPFPCLYWDANGNEIKILNLEDMSRVQPEWTSAPPLLSAETAADRARREFDALSAEDQAFVLGAQRTARMNRLQEKMSHLSDADLASFQKAAPKAVKDKKTA